MAAKICYGENNERLRKIKEELFGEWVYFHEWSDDASELIAGCLYPLKQRDKVYIDLDERHIVATIHTKEQLESPPIWKEKPFIELAEEVTGWKIKLHNHK